MSKVRYIKAWECQECYSTFETDDQAESCCGSNVILLWGYECNQCFKLHRTLYLARKCHPDPKPTSYKEFGIDYEEPVEIEDNSDEIRIGGISVYNTIKPVEVTYD